MGFACVNGGKECDACMCCQDTDTKYYCDICGQPITDHYYEIMGSIYCGACLDDLFRKDVD